MMSPAVCWNLIRDMQNHAYCQVQCLCTGVTTIRWAADMDRCLHHIIMVTSIFRASFESLFHDDHNGVLPSFISRLHNLYTIWSSLGNEDGIGVRPNIKLCTFLGLCVCIVHCGEEWETYVHGTVVTGMVSPSHTDWVWNGSSKAFKPAVT